MRLEIAARDRGQRDVQDHASGGVGDREGDVVVDTRLATVDEREDDFEAIYAVKTAISFAREGIEWCKGRWL